MNTGDIFGGIFYQYDTQNPQKLETDTNCNRANKLGAYVFRVDQEKITSPGCDITTSEYTLILARTKTSIDTNVSFVKKGG